MRRSSSRTGMAAVVVLALSSALTIAMVSSAGATPPDLSSDAGIEAYLVSIGVTDLDDVVWQGTTSLPSHKNYAGPGCPGSDWNCVAANAPIVQITDAGGTNLFACGRVDCVVVQVALSGGQNGGTCLRGENQSNDQTQVCEITQTNDGSPNSTNAAAIAQNIQQSGGSPQSARQVARITQENTLGNNIARIHQVISQRQDTKNTAAIAQTQNAHQAATVEQLTTEGDNTSNITERQNQSQNARKATTITQSQNATTGIDFPCDRPGDLTFDQDKNQCAEVLQTSNLLPTDPQGGSLDSKLLQLIEESQSASTATTSATQTQGNFNGGQGGTVDQVSSGVATSEADQDMLQNMSAFAVPPLGVTQTQHTGDPRCCQTQEDNPNNTADIDQATNQNASSDDAIQSAEFQGTCFSSGTCHVLQTSTIDGSTDSNECTGPSCTEFIICTESGEGGENDCTFSD